MHWLDTTFLGLLALGAGLGFASGFFWQIARIASLALSLLATILLHEAAFAFLQDQVLREADPRIIRAVAYVAVFLAIYLVLYVTTRVLHEGIKATELEAVDRLLGSLFGTAKMALVLGALCLAGGHYPTAREVMAKSVLAPPLAAGTDSVLVVIPDEYKEHLRHTLVNLRDVLQRAPAEPRPPADVPPPNLHPSPPL